MREPRRISFDEYNDDPGKWLEHSKEQRVIVESESGRIQMVLGTIKPWPFPKIYDDIDLHNYEVDDDYEFDPESWLR